MRDIIVTLFEKQYHYGVAALVNSLVVSQFNGVLIAGYRGILPPWTGQLKKINENEYEVAANFILKLQKIKVDLHFGYYKPNFMLDALRDYPNAMNVHYFDPDIVVLANWSFYTKWVACGVSLCLDSDFPVVHSTHPWRSEWKDLGRECDLQIHSSGLDCYFNSGYIGVTRSNKVILERWVELTKFYASKGGDVSRFEKDADRAFKGDQDLLNAALTISADVPLSIIGQEGMGFKHPYYLMLHAVEPYKPWANNFFINAVLRGSKPTGAAKAYIDHAKQPIMIYSKYILLAKKINIKMASLISRILG